MKTLFHNAPVPFFAVLLALILTGCASWPLRAEVRPVQEIQLPELMTRIDARIANLESLKALLTIQLPGHAPIMAKLSWVSPQDLRFTGFGLLGRTLFEVIVSDGLVQWSEPGRPAVLLGTVESLRQHETAGPPGLPITIEDLMYASKVLTNPVLEEKEYAMIEKTEPFYILHGVRFEGDTARLTKRLWIERGKLHLVREEFFGPDASRGLIVKLEDYRSTVMGDWPHRLIIKKPDRDISFKLIFREFKFNTPIAPEEFRIARENIP